MKRNIKSDETESLRYIFSTEKAKALCYAAIEDPSLTLFFTAANAFQDVFNEESDHPSIDDIPELHVHGTFHAPGPEVNTESNDIELAEDDSDKSQAEKADFDEGIHPSIDDIPKEHVHGTSHAPGSKASTESKGVGMDEDESDKSQSGKADFDGGIQVADWRDSLENSAAQEDISTIVFEDCVKVFSLVFHIIRENPDSITSSTCDDLREEFRKFYVWNDSFPIASGELGSILSTSRNLREAVFGLMAQWARALSKGTINSIYFGDY
jgi:hypothetical protein